MATWTATAVLEQARTLAAQFDPGHAVVYRRMPPSRWLHSVGLGAELLTAHAAYRLHHARGRGRRQHSAELHTLLDAANSVNLIAALALMLVTGRVLDQSPRGA
jgi:Co/Zn/Cd efflux system component